MKSIFKTAVLVSAVLFASCGENNKVDKPETKNQPVSPQLIPVQQGTSGDITVVMYNTQKDIKQGEGSFVIEFHNLKSGEPEKVSNIKLEATAQLNGKTLNRKTEITPADEPGTYDVKYNFPEKGLWYFNIGFNDSLKVQMIFSVI